MLVHQVAVTLALLGIAPPIRPPVTALTVTPDDKGFVHASQAGVRYRSFGDTTEHLLATQLEHVHALAFSPDGKSLAIAGGSPAESGAVELWSWPQRKLLGRLEGHDDLVYDAVWLDHGNTVGTASADRTVRLWDAATRKEKAVLRGHSGPVLSLTVAPDGKLLCSGSADQTIRVWDAATGKLLRVLNNHLGAVHSLAFRPAQGEQPALLASAGEDATVRIWQPGIGRMVRIVRHPAPALCVAWSADGARLYSGAKDGRLRRLDVDSDQVLDERTLFAGWVTSLAGRSATAGIVAGGVRGETVVSAGK